MATPNPKFTTGGMSIAQLEKMLESNPPKGSSYEDNKNRIAISRQINRMKARQNKPVLPPGVKSPRLTDKQLLAKELSNRQQIREVLAKKGITVSPKALKPLSPSGKELWNLKELRSTYNEWIKRNPTANPADYTMQHTSPKNEIKTVEDALYAHHPKRVMGQSGRGPGGNFSQQQYRNPEYLQKYGIPSETAVRGVGSILKGLPMVTAPTGFIAEYLMAKKEKRPMNPLKALMGMNNIPSPVANQEGYPEDGLF